MKAATAMMSRFALMALLAASGVARASPPVTSASATAAAVTDTAAGAPTAAASTLFPDAAGPLEAAAVVILRPTSAAVVRLTPVRFVPRAGASQYHDTHFCGVVLDDGTGAPQGVVTIGVGTTETLMCGALLAAGMVPAKAAGTSRIGLIYRTGTLRSSLTTPVVLVRDHASRRWSGDETATAAMDAGKPARTIADIRRKLAARKH